MATEDPTPRSPMHKIQLLTDEQLSHKIADTDRLLSLLTEEQRRRNFIAWGMSDGDPGEGGEIYIGHWDTAPGDVAARDAP